MELRAEQVNLEQECGEGVAQGVNRHVLGNTCR